MYTRSINIRLHYPKIIRTLIILLASVGIGVLWYYINFYSSYLAELPNYVDRDNSLVIHTSNPIDSQTDLLWRVNINSALASKELIATVKRPWRLIDCHLLTDTFCIAQDQKIYRWQTKPSMQSSVDELQLPLKKGSTIFALTPAGNLFFSGTTGSPTEVYFQNKNNPASVITLLQSGEGGCVHEPALSNDGQYVAILCLGDDWVTESIRPLAPTDHHIYIARIDGTQQKRLGITTTYYLDDDGINTVRPIPTVPKNLVWSPDSTEISFAESFTPPKKFPFIPYYFTGTGGIYSVDISNDSVYEWRKPLYYYPLISWSPNKDYMAYISRGKMYIAARNGKYREVGQFDSVDFLSWSPDGSYIVVGGKRGEKIFVLATSTYYWYSFDLPGWIADVAWISK